MSQGDKPFIKPDGTAFVSVKTQFENLGDALIVRELIRQLSARVPTVLDLSRCPDSFVQTLDLAGLPNVVAHRKAGFAKLMAAIAGTVLSGRKAYYFLLPGGLGGDKSTKQYAMGRLNNSLLALLRLLGVRICQGGISYDNLGPRYVAILRKRAAWMFSQVVRDELSLAHARDNGISVDGIVPDYAFGLFDTPPPSDQGRTALAFSFRADKYRDRTPLIVEQIRAIMQLAGPVVVKFVAQVDRDAPFMRELHDAVTDAVPGATLQYHVSARDITACRALYADCRIIYSNRLHALLLAMSAGATPVAIVDPKADVKIVGVFDSMGLSGNVCQLGTLVPTTINSDTSGAQQNARLLGQYFDTILSGARVAHGARTAVELGNG